MYCSLAHGQHNFIMHKGKAFKTNGLLLPMLKPFQNPSREDSAEWVSSSLWRLVLSVALMAFLWMKNARCRSIFQRWRCSLQWFMRGVMNQVRFVRALPKQSMPNLFFGQIRSLCLSVSLSLLCVGRPRSHHWSCGCNQLFSIPNPSTQPLLVLIVTGWRWSGKMGSFY